MSACYCTWIRIGGRLQHAHLDEFLKAVAAAGVGLEWGEPPFEPTSAGELIEVLQEDRLWLCDVEARNGEFPELEKTCRRLRLAYTRHTEGSCDCDAELIDWRPGSKQPLVRIGSNVNTATTYVAADAVREALTALEAGQAPQAIEMLRMLCPDMPELPPFEIV